MVIAFIIVFALVCHGWGGLVWRLCGPGKRVAAVFEIALGLAVLNVAGGLLNCFHAALPASLHVLCVIGAGLSFSFAVTALRANGAKMPGSPLGAVVRWSGELMALLLGAFFCFTLLPAAVFNIHDDFHTYLVRPLRMLATGSVAGNPFDCLGVDSLGTQSFFQAFFLLWAPVENINALDAVFCFSLCGCLIAAVARRLELHPALAVLAVLAFASINPQSVNISPIYTGSLLIGALLLGSWMALEISATETGNGQWRCWIPVGLIFAGLVGLKVTLAFYAGVYLLIFFGLLARVKNQRQRAFRGALATGLAGLVALAPWLAALAPTYLKARTLTATYGATATLAAKYSSVAAHDVKGLLSTHDLYYGGNQLHYNLIALALLVAGGWGAWRWSRSRHQDTLAVLLASAGFAAVASYVWNADTFAVATALRYSCPILIGVFPVCALLGARLLRPEAAKREQPVLANLPMIVVAALQVLIILLFLNVSLTRGQQALRSRTLLAYDFTQGYLDYNRYVFGTAQSDQTRRWQQKLEPGQTILAWTALPFHLNFQRNTILNMSEPGLLNPWLGFPAGVAEDSLMEYLRSWGVRYVALETEGYAIKNIADVKPLLYSIYPIYRKLADYSIYTRLALLGLSQKHAIVHREDDLIIMDLARRSPAVTPQMNSDEQLDLDL